MKRDSLKKLIINGFRELSKGTFTQIPGHILYFDTATQLAQIQIGIVGKTEDGDFDHAPIIQCPVHFTGGQDWSIDHKIEPDDEGMIFFSQRCVDAWLQTGGIAKNPILRFHDKQDAFFIPGFRSKPNAITDFQNDGVRIRNDDASVYLWLKDNGTITNTNGTGSVTISPSGEITSTNGTGTATVSSSGAISLSNGAGFINLLADGSVDINGFIISASGAATMSNGVSLESHVHSQGNDSANDTQQNTSVPTN
jgi:phage baseplate assembly protein gpV